MGPRIWLDAVDSTQTIGVERARAGGVPFETILARQQRAGQGRAGHPWVSPMGGLYLSVIAPVPSAAPSLVPIAVAVEIARALEVATGVTLSVKWPNDLLHVEPSGRSRKVGGILVDRILGPKGPVLVVGVGLDVLPCPEEFPAELRATVAFLGELAAPVPSIGSIADLVVQSIQSAIQLLETPKGRRRVLERARARLYGRGRRASLDGRPIGVVDELSDEGALWLNDAGRRTEVHVGDLVVLEQA